MTTKQLVQAYIARGGTIKKCPPANAKGNEASRLSRAAVHKKARAFKKEQK